LLIIRETNPLSIDDIPKDSRLQQYVSKIEKQVSGDLSKDIDLLEKESLMIFQETGLYIRSKGFSYPTTKVLLIYDHENYLTLEQKSNSNSIVREAAKGESFAFITHNRFEATMYLDMDRLLKLLVGHGYPTYILILVSTFIHEFLHLSMPSNSEQKTHDLECITVEDYLGIELPKAFKELRASNYYERNT